MFELFMSDSRNWSARQIEGGVLIHSARDPLGEARSVASVLTQRGDSKIWIIGDGLGYLSDELRRMGLEVIVIETFPDIKQLVRTEPSDSSTSSVKERLVELLRAMNERKAVVYVAPYVRSLIELLPAEVADLINEIAVLSNSRDEYARLIRTNLTANGAILQKLPGLRCNKLMKIAIACGSGPSLHDVLLPMKESRSSFTLVACSSAVPFLIRNGLTPDWTVAMEAHQGVARDLELLPPCARVVVFEWTDPQVFELMSLDLRRAEEPQNALETGGGTTLLTAADMAVRLAASSVYLVGADLSWSQGLYAGEDAQANGKDERRFAPKFSVMRSKFEQWISRHRAIRISHVVSNKSLMLKGARHVSPNEFSCELELASSRASNIVES